MKNTGHSARQGGKRNPAAPAGKKGKAGSSPRRKLVVFVSLLGVLSLTSFLLLAMAPAPLAPGASMSLFAYGADSSFDRVFETRVPVETGRWRYVYVRQSLTAGGDALSLGQAAGGAGAPDGAGDHFVVGNGDGCGDGEIQICKRWMEQQTAAPPATRRDEPRVALDEHCISICVVGNFNQTAPTSTQLRRLEQLVQVLQDHCNVRARNVAVRNDLPGSAAGVGRYFPTSAFREQLVAGTSVSR